jgi:3-phenylpropionate/trans-cinnamate dioxygenase ferredoxin component
VFATAKAALRAPNSGQDKGMSEKAFTAAAKLDEVPAGAKKLVEVNGTEVVLCNTRDQIFAVRNQCSHAYEKLDCGRMKNGWISCPVHGARFDLETGAALNPPAVMPIDVFAVRVVGDVIEVAV